MTATPVEIDTQLAELYRAGMKNDDRRIGALQTLHRLSGSAVTTRTYGKSITTNALSNAEAVAVVQAAYDAEVAGTYDGPISGYELLYAGGKRSLEQLAACEVESARIEAASAPLEAVYAEHRWSRFFLVTSSNGHVHANMNCSTCRVTTTYGWMPELSGKSEDEAVAELGPALCSVCFPSAPVAHQGGKITKAKAAKMSV